MRRYQCQWRISVFILIVGLISESIIIKTYFRTMLSRSRWFFTLMLDETFCCYSMCQSDKPSSLNINLSVALAQFTATFIIKLFQLWVLVDYVECSLTNYQNMKNKFCNLTIKNILSFAPRAVKIFGDTLLLLCEMNSALKLMINSERKGYFQHKIGVWWTFPL